MMKLDEKTIRMASRLYAARDSARKFLGKNYLATMASMQEIIREFMKNRSCDALPATMAIVTQLQKENPHVSGYEQMLILAAYVEMVEPTKAEEAA